jgi:hypothetical protein
MPTEGTGLSGQDEKRGLKRVFGVLGMPEVAPADVKDEPAVAPHQFGKGFLILAVGVALEELSVGDVAVWPTGELLNVPK